MVEIYNENYRTWDFCRVINVIKDNKEYELEILNKNALSKETKIQVDFKMLVITKEVKINLRISFIFLEFGG